MPIRNLNVLSENKKLFPFFRQLAFPLRIFLLILVVSVFIVAALAQYLSASFEDYLASHVRDMAMNQAKLLLLTTALSLP